MLSGFINKINFKICHKKYEISKKNIIIIIIARSEFLCIFFSSLVNGARSVA